MIKIFVCGIILGGCASIFAYFFRKKRKNILNIKAWDDSALSSMMIYARKHGPFTVRKKVKLNQFCDKIKNMMPEWANEIKKFNAIMVPVDSNGQEDFSAFKPIIVERNDVDSLSDFFYVSEKGIVKDLENDRDNLESKDSMQN